ncbi:hypothetical protein [Echinococcus multilocularis]|uniref:Uncharacterized protein n=1 Tax=Echinococcus multilocularis TaxID=6211 RepID=A0A068Y2E1_ECHMU|nr:hypothetical protein [Echinococcus multilocularis]
MQNKQLVRVLHCNPVLTAEEKTETWFSCEMFPATTHSLHSRLRSRAISASGQREDLSARRNVPPFAFTTSPPRFTACGNHSCHYFRYSHTLLNNCRVV